MPTCLESCSLLIFISFSNQAWLTSRALMFVMYGPRACRLLNTPSSSFVIGSPALLFCSFFFSCVAPTVLFLYLPLAVPPAIVLAFPKDVKLILLENPLLHHNLYPYLGLHNASPLPQFLSVFLLLVHIQS